jgi:hypothetical protein
MAVVALQPATINAQIRRGQNQTFKSTAVLDFAGAAINMSGWFSYAAKLVAQSPNPNTADVTFGTVTGNADGTLTLLYDASDLASVPVGTAQLIITGVHVSGDDSQLLASGSAQLSEG